MKRLSPIINILAAAILCGTAWFIYQDFKVDYDKCEQDRLTAIKSQTEVLQDQNGSLLTLRLLANDELQRRKSQATFESLRREPLKPDSATDDRVADGLDKIATELIANNNELNAIATELKIANTKTFR